MNKLGQHDLQQQQDLGEVDSTPTLSCLSYLASKAGASSIAGRSLAPVSVDSSEESYLLSLGSVAFSEVEN